MTCTAASAVTPKSSCLGPGGKPCQTQAYSLQLWPLGGAGCTHCDWSDPTRFLLWNSQSGTKEERADLKGSPTFQTSLRMLPGQLGGEWYHNSKDALDVGAVDRPDLLRTHSSLRHRDGVGSNSRSGRKSQIRMRGRVFLLKGPKGGWAPHSQ